MTDMDDTIRVELTEAEKAEMGERLARMLAERDALKDQRQKAMDDASKNIKTLEDVIDELAEALREGRKEKRQGDLFHEEKPAPAEVGELLHQVAEHAEGTAAADVAAAYVPSEPHPFLATSAGPECGICGGADVDPIHAGKANELVESLQRVNDGESAGAVVTDIKTRRAKRAKGKKRGPHTSAEGGA